MFSDGGRCMLLLSAKIIAPYQNIQPIYHTCLPHGSLINKMPFPPCDFIVHLES